MSACFYVSPTCDGQRWSTSWVLLFFFYLRVFIFYACSVMTCWARWPGEHWSSCCAPPCSQPTETLPVWVTQVSSFTSQHLLHCYLSTLAQKRTHTFNTISPEPPLILSRISVYYGISPKLGGVRRDLLCPESVVFLLLGWKKKDEIRGTGNDRAPFMCSVLSVECKVTVLCVFIEVKPG